MEELEPKVQFQELALVALVVEVLVHHLEQELQELRTLVVAAEETEAAVQEVVVQADQES